jgi:MSHA biogenesis protein MshJ
MKNLNRTAINKLIKDIKTSLQPMLDQYNALPSKQRSQIIFIAPVASKTKELKNKTAALVAMTEQNRSIAQNILSQVQQSIANPRSSQSVKLMTEIEALNAGLSVYYEATVSPSEMGEVLRELLSEDRKLSFVSMTSLPTIEVLTEKPEFSEFTKIEKRPKLYKRGVEIVFRGTYRSTFSYLKRLEAYHKKIFWDHFIYQVKEYPIAEVTMTVYTLTDEESWIGR